MQRDYHVRGSMLDSLQSQAETFICGTAALSKKDAAEYVAGRLAGDGYLGVVITSVVTLTGKSTLPLGSPIHYGSGQ